MRARALPLILVLGLVAACDQQGCADLPVRSGVRIQVPAAIQKVTPNLRVELCQAKTCRSVNFPRSSADGTVATGVTAAGDAYVVDLATLGSGWKPDGAVGLTVLGTSRRGRLVLKHTEQFSWDVAFPNGEGCGDAELKHSTSVGADDLLG